MPSIQQALLSLLSDQERCSESEFTARCPWAQWQSWMDPFIRLPMKGRLFTQNRFQEDLLPQEESHSDLYRRKFSLHSQEKTVGIPNTMEARLVYPFHVSGHTTRAPLMLQFILPLEKGILRVEFFSFIYFHLCLLFFQGAVAHPAMFMTCSWLLFYIVLEVWGHI